jgi:hypothetical protein
VSVWWSITLSAGSLWTSWLVGSRKRVGFLLAVAMQLVWIGFALDSGQWGFIASAAVFSAVNVRNYLRWKRLDEAEARDDAVMTSRARIAGWINQIRT